MITINKILDCELYLQNVQGVIFDLDDTLFSEKEYVNSGYAAVAAAFPFVKDMQKRLWDAFEQKLPAIDFVLEQEGLLSEKAKALNIYRTHIPTLHLYHGVYELLHRLRETKKLALITDGRPDGQRAKISALGLAPLFDVIIVTDELGGAEYRKPNETSFRLVQQKWDIPFEALVYIGDNPRKDFVAPQALGMKSIYFKNEEGIYF